MDTSTDCPSKSDFSFCSRHPPRPSLSLCYIVSLYPHTFRFVNYFPCSLREFFWCVSGASENDDHSSTLHRESVLVQAIFTAHANSANIPQYQKRWTTLFSWYFWSSTIIAILIHWATYPSTIEKWFFFSKFDEVISLLS